MTATPAIRAEHLSKSYNVYRRPIDRFLELFLPRQRHTVFSALEDVSFTLQPGESLGLVGRNGAGKSTLLKILCDVTRATSGTVEIGGKVSSILELGTGFHPDFTGRSNASLNAAILGLGPEERAEKLPLICEFSELGEFLDRPVKTYSSGMYMRLAFSVAVSVDPDILIVDEALAVGDGHFQRKCLEKIREFQERRKTIVFCSHSLAAVNALCSRTLWLDGGRARMFGSSSEVIRAYETFLLRQKSSREELVAEDEARVSPVRITGVRLLDSNGSAGRTFPMGTSVTIEMTIESQMPSQRLHFLASVDRALDQMQCFATATHWDGLEPVGGSQEYRTRVTIPSLPLSGGEYTLMVYVGDEAALHVFDRKIVTFWMTGETVDNAIFDVEHEWKVASGS